MSMRRHRSYSDEQIAQVAESLDPNAFEVDSFGELTSQGSGSGAERRQAERRQGDRRQAGRS